MYATFQCNKIIIPTDYCEGTTLYFKFTFNIKYTEITITVTHPKLKDLCG